MHSISFPSLLVPFWSFMTDYEGNYLERASAIRVGLGIILFPAALSSERRDVKARPALPCRATDCKVPAGLCRAVGNFSIADCLPGARKVPPALRQAQGRLFGTGKKSKDLRPDLPLVIRY